MKAIYYRVSSDKQDIQSQRKAVEDYLENKGIPMSKCKIYSDEGISGVSDARPGYQKLIADCIAGKIDEIIVYKLDRFSRNANTAITTLIQLDSHGVGFISVTQPILSLGKENPFRRTMLSAFAEIAEIERQSLVERTKAGMRAAKAKGKKIGRPKKITDEIKEKIYTLRDSGITVKAISKATNLSAISINRVLKERKDAEGL